jgi:hypothetical protein
MMQAENYIIFFGGCLPYSSDPLISETFKVVLQSISQLRLFSSEPAAEPATTRLSLAGSCR